MPPLADKGRRGRPAADNFIECLALVEPHTAVSKGQLIDGLRLEHIAYVEVRRAVICTRIIGPLVALSALQ